MSHISNNAAPEGRDSRLRRQDDPLLRRYPVSLQKQIASLRALPMRSFLRRSGAAIDMYLRHLLPYTQEAMQKGYTLHEIYDTLYKAHPLAIGERQFRKYMRVILEDTVCIACGQPKSKKG